MTQLFIEMLLEVRATAQELILALHRVVSEQKQEWGDFITDGLGWRELHLVQRKPLNFGVGKSLLVEPGCQEVEHSSWNLILFSQQLDKFLAAQSRVSD